MLARMRWWPGEYGWAVASGYIQMGVTTAIQLLAVPLYLEHLGRYQFGVLVILLSFLTYAAIGTMWMSAGATRLLGETFARGDEGRFRTGYALAKRFNTGYAVVLSMLAVIGAGLFWRPDAQIDATTLTLTAVSGTAYFILLYMFSIDRIALTARGRQSTANLLTIVQQVAFVALLIPALHGDLGLPGVLGALTGGTMVAMVASALVWRGSGLALTWHLAEPVRPLMGYFVGRVGGGYMLYGLFSLTLQADTLLIGWLAGPEMAASFVLVWKVAEVALLLLWRLPDTLQPYVIHLHARGDIAGLRAQMRRWLPRMWALGAVAGLGYAVVGPFVVEMWVGAEQAPAQREPFWLAGGALFWLTAARLPMIAAFATVRLRPLLIIMGLELCGKIALILLFFPTLGHWAPLVAINVVHAAGIAGAYVWLARRVARDQS